MFDRTTARPTLSKRYALQVAVITISLLLVSGASEMYFGYREAREHIARLQLIRAEAATQEIEQFLRTTEVGVSDVMKLPWGLSGFGMAQQREEFYRLMVLFPAITELRFVSADGIERLFVSKSEADRVGDGKPFRFPQLLPTAAASPLRYGDTYFRDASLPFIDLAVPDPRGSRNATVVTIDLRFLADVVSKLKVGEDGRTYIVDAASRLIAHPLATNVLMHLDLANAPHVQAARAASRRPGGPLLSAVDSSDLDGRPMITTAMRVAAPNWILFVEEPRSSALAPALSTLTRTLILVLTGGSLALIASVYFARRMAAPIVDLRRATGRIAQGDLESRITVSSSDEIEQLANDFNEMTRKLRESYSGLEAKVLARTRELSEARDKLQAQAGEMERLNDQLTHQLAELALRKEEAERANAAKTRFLDAASHDLRQPMHSIGLLLSVLHDRLESPVHIDLARKILMSVTGMEHLFSGLLDISKLDAGAVRARPQSLELAQMLSQLTLIYGPQAAERGLSLRIVSSRVTIKSDPDLLETILGNLVSNSLRYTNAGSVLVGCRPRGERIAIQVIDTGIGIAAEHLDDIFEEFFRVDANWSGHGKGLGLGLSIVKRSAAILGHELRVRSTPGRGSVFELLVPRLEASGLQTLPRTAPAEDRARIAGAFLLIIDDDEDNRMALQSVCAQWQCSVLAAASADQAVDELQQHLRAPDLIIVDYRLAQHRTGLQALEQVRNRIGESIPAIIVTADSSGELGDSPLQSGVTVLSKPVNAQRLLRAVVVAIQLETGALAAVDSGN